MKPRTMVVAAMVLLAGAAVWAQAMRNVPRISIDELKTLIEKKGVVVIDVRDPSSFEAGRIPGAMNIDYVEMPQRAAAFVEETRPIVTYCACTNETTAARAVLDLNQAGVTNAKALAGGWNEWIKRGQPVEKQRPSLQSSKPPSLQA